MTPKTIQKPMKTIIVDRFFRLRHGDAGFEDLAARLWDLGSSDNITIFSTNDLPVASAIGGGGGDVEGFNENFAPFRNSETASGQTEEDFNSPSEKSFLFR
mmetsp:Transcript_42461/g.83452  ORF Transcript_42461/g.83452 Transcript_42461/m.83452 type:complete len:101 (-) Transcript_42461:139-441(-)